MARKMFKCFVCGKIYKSKEKARECHGAPLQNLLKQDRDKPKFLGN